MAITATVNTQHDLGGGCKLITGTLAFDSSFVGAAGEPLDLSSYFPGGTVRGFHATPQSGLKFAHSRGTPTSGTIMVYSGTAYVASATDLSAFSAVPFIALGE